MYTKAASINNKKQYRWQHTNGIQKIQNNKFIAEDIRTVHAEIKQIINQRYIIITAAITLLGLFITCITQIDRLRVNELFLEPAYFIGIFFLLLLLLLNFYGKTLTKQLLTLSSFLVVLDLSTYEKLWGLYPRSKLTGYSYCQKIFFYILAILILTVCLLYTWATDTYISLLNVMNFSFILITFCIILEITNRFIINKKVIQEIKYNWEKTFNHQNVENYIGEAIDQ